MRLARPATALLAALLAATVLAASPSALASAAATPKLKVVTEPAAGYGFLDRAVAGARHTVLVEMYELADATFEADLIAAASRHVAVQVLLDKDYDAGDVNQPAFAELSAHHVAVRWADASYIFHEKAVVVDGATAYVGTGNLTSEYYATTRDFWVVDTQHADVVAIAAVLHADWPGGPPAAGGHGADLVWSPGAQSAVVALINRARHSISLESEELSSKPVVAALVAAAHRHVVVHVTMTYDSSWRTEFAELLAAGAKVHVDHGESPVYIHAKALCVDCATPHVVGVVLVGSQNLSDYSLTRNRELSIETSAGSVVGPIDAILASDFAAASPYVP